MIVFDDRYVTLRPSDYWVFDEGNSSVMSNSAFGWFTTDNHFVAGCTEHEWVQQKPIKYEEVDVIKWTGENEKEIVKFGLQRWFRILFRNNSVVDFIKGDFAKTIFNSMFIAANNSGDIELFSSLDDAMEATGLS